MNAINRLLEISAYSAVLFLAVMAIKKAFRNKLSPVLHFMVWFLLIARLCLPVTIDSGFKLIVIPEQAPAAASQTQDTASSGFDKPASTTIETPRNSNTPIVSQPQQMQTPALPQTPNRSNADSQPTGSLAWADIFVAVWLTGVFVSAAWLVLTFLKMNRVIRKLGTEPPLRIRKIMAVCKKAWGIRKDIPVFLMPNISTPALTVGFRPRMMLPADLAETLNDRQLEFALKHELTHYKRKDHLTGLLLRILQAVYWFNPVVWLLGRFMIADMETACDSMVIKTLDQQQKKQYILTLLDMFSSKRAPQFLLGMALNNTEKIAEKRIRGAYMNSTSKRSAKLMAGTLAVILVIGCFTTACQPTPAEEIVVRKDTEQMVEQAADNSAGQKVSKLKVPDGSYTYQASGADGKLAINVNAPVSVPESEKMPTARVSESGFTQEQVTAFFNYLFPDEQPVTGDNVPRVMTKDEIEELILVYKKSVADGTTDDYMYTEEEMEDEIKRLEKEHESAPETAPIPDTQISDGTMTTETTGGDKYDGEEIMVLDAGTENKRLYVSIPVDANAGNENYLGFHVDNGPYYGHFSELNAVRIDEDNWSEVIQGKLSTSYQDAKALCDGFFEAGSITDVVLSDAFMIDDEETQESFAHAAQNYAYEFCYVRTVGGAAVANMSYLGSGGDETSLPWMYERIIFWVSDHGIESVEWASHTMPGEIINEDTGVIDFEEARDIFEKMIVTKYGASSEWPEPLSNVSVDIDGIELSLVRVREQNAPGRNGIYTPAWVFYGNIKQELEFGEEKAIQYGWDIGGGYPFTKCPVLIVNAIDGSIIDPVKGY